MPFRFSVKALEWRRYLCGRASHPLPRGESQLKKERIGTMNPFLRKSGIGLPHSTTLAHITACHSFREVVECGSPMPLSRVDCGIRKPDRGKPEKIDRPIPANIINSF
jgi:hypothetical protein